MNSDGAQDFATMGCLVHQTMFPWVMPRSFATRTLKEAEDFGGAGWCSALGFWIRITSDDEMVWKLHNELFRMLPSRVSVLAVNLQALLVLEILESRAAEPQSQIPNLKNGSFRKLGGGDLILGAL